MPIPQELLKQGARDLGVELSRSQIEQFELFADMLLEWNRKFNLTRITEPEEIVTKHFLDSLTCLQGTEIKPGAKMIDVGTGPGMPGIPMKIARPDTALVLLDSVRKKLLFLQEVVQRLRLSDVQILHARAEDAGRDRSYRGRYDIVLARALGKLPQVVELCLPFATLGGTVLAMRGPEPESDLDSGRGAIEVLGGKVDGLIELCLPGTDIRRSIIVIRKVRRTPGRFPRTPAEIQRTPL